MAVAFRYGLVNSAQLAVALLQARRAGKPGAEDLVAPASLEEAYAVQQIIASELGEIGGWKIGASSPEDLQPLFAPMPRQWMNSPARGRLRGVEVEIAFLLGRDLLKRDEPYSRAEVMAAIESAHPALEILDSGIAEPDKAPRLLKIADLQINGGFVAGAAIGDWQNRDWSRESVTLRINGELKKQRTGSNAAGDLMRLLVYLANEGSDRTGGLRTGQWITTGSWTGADYCQPGDVAEGRFTSSETVSVTFA